MILQVLDTTLSFRASLLRQVPLLELLSASAALLRVAGEDADALIDSIHALQAEWVAAVCGHKLAA